MNLNRNKQRQARPVVYEASSYAGPHDAPKGSTVVIGGDLVLVTTDQNAKCPEGYTALPPRPAGLRPFSQNKTKIYIFVRSSLLTRRGPYRFVLSLEAILAWLRANKKHEEFLLVAGIPASHETLAQVFHVRRNAIAQIEERRLPAGEEPSFRGDVFNYLERLRQQYPNIPCYWGVPTLPCPDKDIPDVSEQLYKTAHRLPKLPVEHASNVVLQFTPGIMAALGGCAVYIMAVGYPYLQYHQAHADFLGETHNLQAGVPYSAELLTLLKERKQYLEQATGRADKVDQFNELLRKAADPAYPLKEAYLQLQKDQLNGANSGGPTGDFYFKLVASPELGLTALEQSRPIAEKISAKVGSPLWISPDGIRDDSAPNKPDGTREYRLEGNFNAKP